MGTPQPAALEQRKFLPAGEKWSTVATKVTNPIQNTNER